MLLIRVVQRGLGLMSTLILARLLVPEDFGIVAAALLWLYLADALAESGASQYLIQTDHIDRTVIDTAWTLDVLLKGLAAAALFALASSGNLLASDERTLEVLRALAPAVLLKAFTNPQIHVELRELRYDAVLKVQLWQKLVSFAVVVSIASATGSYWAIVVGHYASTGAQVALSWAVCKRGARPGMRTMSSQWAFSKWILGRGVFGYLRAQLDVFAVSRYFPTDTFGHFTVAREVAVMPALDIIGPLVQPLLASLSRVRTDRERAARQVRVVLLAVGVIVFPPCAFMLFRANEIVAFVLGEKWAEAGPMLVVLTPLLLSYALGGVMNNVILALGRVRALFFYDLVSVIAVALVLYAFREAAITEIVLARSLTGIVVTTTAIWWAGRMIGVTLAQVGALLAGPAAVALVAVLATPPNQGTHPGVAIVTSALLTFTIYVLSISALAFFARHHSSSWRQLSSTAADLAMQLLRRLRR